MQVELPLSYWGDCVLTPLHNINRLPNSVLGNVTPFEKLFDKKPSYAHLLKAFGCLDITNDPS